MSIFNNELTFVHDTRRRRLGSIRATGSCDCVEKVVLWPAMTPPGASHVTTMFAVAAGAGDDRCPN